MRSIYADLTGDSSASETELIKGVDQKAAEFLLSTEEEEIIYDLRKLNGENGKTKFDAFWEETQKYIEVIVPAVHERRHGEQLYLPFIISIEQLRNTIQKRLPTSTDIPSNEWLRLQFWPKNVTSLRALQHTGRFDLKFVVQQRLLRATHPDAKYCAVQYKYLRNFAVKLRNFSKLIYLDDKSIVPLG
ncbi:hypothetical protein LOTGIDRAFT_165357 [Lottia gigantea]|uniref:Uncharacterized protein n=1 Tax=Lottia gigantea TaxID=225164 RepID=V4BIW3_LOTGI|nr:hypothetical protein LOTGIDRAFT_165357 [Lottia gigantea]ESO88574.1 hypothetical protein LOTGIDRAFT_165357 [Lottia gigantea]